MRVRTETTRLAPQMTRIERILEPFGARHAAGLIDFFNKVAEADFDLVVFMARKSLCIYRMMELCGTKKVTIPMVSDALLDSNPKLFESKRVLVVDDTLFVGTTLSDAKERLSTCKPANLEFWVYCADGDTWSEENFKPDYIHAVVTAQEAIEFCASECRAMINAGIPYLSDFAASRRIRLAPKELDRAIKPINWAFHDVSSQYHEKSKVKYYSAFPDNFTNSVVRSSIGSSIFDLIELAKIRTFATWTGRKYEVTFVPVITFSPTDRKSLSGAVYSLCDTLNIDHRLFTPSNIMVEMRFLQFLIGSFFLRTYWDSFDRIIQLDPDTKFSFEWCSSVFSPTQADAVSNAIAQIYNHENSLPRVTNAPKNLVRSEPPEIHQETMGDIEKFLEDYFSGDTNIDFGHTPLSDLTAIFLEFQNRFETAARDEIRQRVSNPKYRDRLKRGMAWRALCSYLLSKYGRKKTRYNRNILSLVLDRLIDFGIAVPIIAISGDNVYRAYRHGEDVKFGAQEESLVFNLLKGFQSARGSQGIEATYIEKLIVIMLRVGMNEEWLNLWYSNSGRDTLVRVGYHLQGAVAISAKREDELVPDGETSWLSRRLLKTGTLTKTVHPKRKGELYHLGKAPEAAHVRTDAPRTARSLGSTLGKACITDGQSRTAERPIASEDLIILTSCANALDTTGAVAAELQIFAEWYEQTGARILRVDFMNPKSRHFQAAIKGSNAAQAINSAAWKLEKFEEHAFEKIKEKVKALANHDSDWDMREGFWDAVFSAFDRVPEDNEGKKLERIRETAADLIVCFKFLLLCIDHFSKLGKLQSEENITEFLTTLSSSNLPNTVPVPDLAMIKSNLSNHQLSNVAMRRRIADAAKIIDCYGQSLCALASEEVAIAEKMIVKANLKLSRIQYTYMIWYDILDVRIRNQITPNATDEYSQAVDKFRADVNRMLSNAQERIGNARGHLFCDSGDIASFNDAKHIFLNLPEKVYEEGNRIACDISRIAQSSGIKLRLLAVPTNLRGDYVYLNRGSTSIDGDFKSHVHTIIQKIQHHEVEGSLSQGECVVWMLNEWISRFQNYGSIRFDKKTVKEKIKISVNIRGFIVENEFSKIIIRN